MVGLSEVGVEWDHAACQTATAAGFQRIEADVAVYPSAPFVGVKGYIASPSCTLFSNLGSKIGRRVIDVLSDGIAALFAGQDTRVAVRDLIYAVALPVREAENAKRPEGKRWTQARVETRARDDAYTAALVLEPARRIMDLDPEWVALEQVGSVLPLWETYAEELRKRGYAAWAGVLNAADYGVPQTRLRAFLMASRVRAVEPPAPTHSKTGDEGDLFGGARARWVSLASALDWPEPGEVLAPARTLPVERPRAGAVAKAHQRTAAEEARDPDSWTRSRPSTTIAGRDLVGDPGANANRFNSSTKTRNDGIRVPIEDRGVLQTFPAAYPWRGTRSKQDEQVGNAVPPLLAAHVLAAVVGVQAPAGAPDVFWWQDVCDQAAAAVDERLAG